MNFINKKSITFFLIASSVLPLGLEASMKDMYKKNSANQSSCTSSTAKYQKYSSWDKATRYHCVTKDGTVIKLSNGRTEIIGSTRKVKQVDPVLEQYKSQYSGELGKRYEYSEEGNELIRYFCKGYYECKTSPVRDVIGKTFSKSSNSNTKKYNVDDAYSRNFQKGLDFYKNRNFSEAKSNFGQAISLKPTESAYGYRGLSNYMLKDYISAIYDFGRVIDFNPKNSQAFLYMGLSQILENSDTSEILKGCKNIDQASKLGNKAASNFLSQKNKCSRMLN